MSDKKHIHIIDAARGIAAVYILFHHAFFLSDSSAVFAQNILLKSVYDISSAFTIHILMLFFLLSGFSIHYANQGRIVDSRSGPIRSYLYKRIRRIYPIYLLAVVLSIFSMFVLSALGKGSEWPYPTTSQLIGTLLCFSDLPSHLGTWIPTLSTNGPLWSLSYEVLYYLLYPLFSIIAHRTNVSASVGFSALLSASAVIFALICGPNQISNMLSLYILWCLGALLAELKRKNTPISINPLAQLIIIMGWAQALWISESFLLWRIPLGINLFIGLFIFCVMLFGISTPSYRGWKTLERVTGVAFLLTLVILTCVIAVKFRTTNNYPFLYLRTALVFFIGLLWLCGKPDSLFAWMRTAINYWYATGAYSYGLYILQFPLLIIGYALATIYTNSPLWGMLGVIPVLLIARFVELRLQPVMSRLMDKGILKKNLSMSASA